MALELEELSGQVIGSAIEVHRTLGPGFVESIYEEALAVELGHRKIPFERQFTVGLVYRDVEVGRHRLALFVANQIVVELKAIKELNPAHFAMVRSYLRAVDRQHGLLLNFAKATLEIKRVLARPSPD